MSKIATVLDQILDHFDPREPLSGSASLNNWYVDRSGSPRRQLQILLERAGAKDKDEKILFVGHRGAGKSTELNKLAAGLDDHYLVVPVDVFGLTGQTSPRYEDLMLVLGTRIAKACLRPALLEKVSDLLEPIQDWWTRVFANTVFKSGTTDKEIAFSLASFLGEGEVSFKQSSQTRDSVLAQLNQQMPELLRHTNAVLERAKKAGKAVLVIVEGLDKIDLEAARSIFLGRAPTITALHTHMIFTFPLALRHSDDFNAIRGSFTNTEFLTNLATHHADGTRDEVGYRCLESLVLQRVDKELIAPAALDAMIEMSGGLPAHLVELVRRAGLQALEWKAPAIELASAEKAIRDLRRDLSAPLKRADYKVLEDRHQDHQLTNDEAEQRLLFNAALVEYANGRVWCDAHPALWQHLEERKLLMEQPEAQEVTPAAVKTRSKPHRR
jgi:energy-coupling factor transporter ATP-binding protein EcfA2